MTGVIAIEIKRVKTAGNFDRAGIYEKVIRSQRERILMGESLNVGAKTD